jgi:hypothetical protein
MVFMVPGYVYLASYFIAQVVYWYFDKKAGSVATTAFSVHIAGFVFGAGFDAVVRTAPTGSRARSFRPAARRTHHSDTGSDDKQDP